MNADAFIGWLLAILAGLCFVGLGLLVLLVELLRANGAPAESPDQHPRDQRAGGAK